MGKTSYSKQEWSKAGFSNFIVAEEVDAPYTEIVNRAKVKQPSLKSMMGVERIPFYNLEKLADEFGPDGEVVYKFSGETSNRVRVVGEVSAVSQTSGTYINMYGDSFAEITFYGTGLNLLGFCQTGTRQFDVSVNNGSPVVVSTVGSTVLNARGYNPNVVFSLVEGETLGWYTVKVAANASSSTTFIAGFEILNEATSIQVKPGSAFCGMKKETLPALASSSYNAGVVGTKGARVVKYIKDGVISQVVQEVPSSPSYLTNADHTNEEIIKVIHWREFGANRADDFSTLAAGSSDRGYTLDDGVTTLVADSVATINFPTTPELYIATSGFITLTCVCSGLDIVIASDTTDSTNLTVSVDGVSAGALALVGTSKFKVLKVASGLSCGTHTFKIARIGGTINLALTDLIPYQPKKPTLPVGAVEIADYNVMTTYSYDASYSEGVLIKQGVRELLYVGSGFILALDIANYPRWGWRNQQNSSSGDYIEYTFFGEGFELFMRSNTAYSNNISVLLNGIALNSTNYSTAVSNTNGPSYSLSTAVLNAAASNVIEGKFSISGLPLAKYTVRFTNNTSSAFLTFGLGVITPIHINDSSFKIGSLSLKQNQKMLPSQDTSIKGVDLSKAKALLIYDGVNQKIVCSRNISAVIAMGTGTQGIYFETPFKEEPVIVVSSDRMEERIAGVNNNLLGSKKSVTVVRTLNSSGASDSVNYLSLVAYGELVNEENL